MKYYFITYRAEVRNSDYIVYWNQVINVNPMKFIKHIIEVEENNSNLYYNFSVINTCEITEEEYDEYVDKF